MEVFPALSACSLFAGLTQDEIAAILPCLSARQAGFRRGQFLLRAGDEVRFAGVVLAGEVELLQEDFTPAKLAATAVELLAPARRPSLQADLAFMKQRLGEPGAVGRVAQLILRIAEEKK